MVIADMAFYKNGHVCITYYRTVDLRHRKTAKRNFTYHVDSYQFKIWYLSPSIVPHPFLSCGRWCSRCGLLPRRPGPPGPASPASSSSSASRYSQSRGGRSKRESAGGEKKEEGDCKQSCGSLQKKANKGRICVSTPLFL